MLYVSFKKLFSNSSVFNTLDCIVDSLVLTAGSSRSTSVSAVVTRYQFIDIPGNLGCHYKRFFKVERFSPSFSTWAVPR